MDIEYCGKTCEIGKAKSNELLANNNSVFDAALDFRVFTTECLKDCPYRYYHETVADESSILDD